MTEPDATDGRSMRPTDERRMRIAHIGGKGLPSRGGTERVIEAIASRHALEHDVTVYGSRRICSSAMFKGIRVVAVPVPAGKYAAPVVLDVLSAPGIPALARPAMAIHRPSLKPEPADL